MKALILTAICANLLASGEATAQPAAIVEGAGVKVGEGTVIHPILGIETGVVQNVFYEDTNPKFAGLLQIIGELAVGSLPSERMQDSTAADWQKVIAVRLAVVARSMQPEKPNPATNLCDATTAAPIWQTKGVAIDLSANPNWKCYRYRLFEVTVPLRNMVWYAQPS